MFKMIPDTDLVISLVDSASLWRGPSSILDTGLLFSHSPEFISRDLVRN
jgi:hypothetical protein